MADQRQRMALAKVIDEKLHHHALKIGQQVQQTARAEGVELAISIRSGQSSQTNRQVQLMLHGPHLQHLEFGHLNNPMGGKISRWLSDLKSSQGRSLTQKGK